MEQEKQKTGEELAAKIMEYARDDDLHAVS